MTTTTRLPTTAATNWRADAACARVDPELFFPVGDSALARWQAEQAKQICYQCPVMELCGQYAFETRQDSGVWGGLSEQERFSIHRRRGHSQWARPRNVAQHMYEERREELVGLLGEGLAVSQVASRMGTNVQTVNRLLERLAEEEAVSA